MQPTSISYAPRDRLTESEHRPFDEVDARHGPDPGAAGDGKSRARRHPQEHAAEGIDLDLSGLKDSLEDERARILSTINGLRESPPFEESVVPDSLTEDLPPSGAFDAALRELLLQGFRKQHRL